jgi:hypothetical protein
MHRILLLCEGSVTEPQYFRAFLTERIRAAG